MEPRNLYNVTLKIIGIFFIKDILEAFSRLLSVLVYLPQYATESEGYFNLGVTVPPLILYSLFAWSLIFKTDSVISLLRLDKGTPAGSPEMRFDRRTVITTAILVIGGWMLVNETPEFFRHAVYYVQERRLYARIIRPDISYIAMSAFKILFALFLIILSRPIAALVEKFGTRSRGKGRR